MFVVCFVLVDSEQKHFVDTFGKRLKYCVVFALKVWCPSYPYYALLSVESSHVRSQNAGKESIKNSNNSLHKPNTGTRTNQWAAKFEKLR